MWTYCIEPRRFRHAFFLFFLCASALAAPSLQLDQWWMSLPIALVLMLSPFITIVFLFINEISLVRREGFSLSHALPLLFACTIVAWFVALPAALLAGLPAVVLGLVAALTVCGVWFSSHAQHSCCTPGSIVRCPGSAAMTSLSSTVRGLWERS